MPQPVAQRLGFGAGERTVRQQCLRPTGQVAGGQDQFEPDGVAAPQVKRQVPQAGGLAALDGGEGV